MKIESIASASAKLAGITFCLCLPLAANAALFDLGTAGPQNFAVLEIPATGSSTISMAAAPPNGFVTGNIGGANSTSITTSAGNFPINGTVYLGSTSSANAATAANATGGVVQTAASQALLAQAASDAISASVAASMLATSGGGVGITTISLGNNVTLNLMPGVYNLTDFKLQNNDVVNLAAGGQYVFNISGQMTLNSAVVLAGLGLSPGDVLFNYLGTQSVSFAGGLNNESMLDGVILARNAPVSLTPGFVEGEIIAGRNINIASGGAVQGIGGSFVIPEPSTVFAGALLLAPLGAGLLRRLRKGNS